MAIRTGFVTCVQLGLSCVEAVLESGGRFDVLVSLRDDLARAKSGRIYLDEVAENHTIPLHKIRHTNDVETIDLLKSYDLDWLFVIGWSQLLSDAALQSVRQGVLGMHPTLLPIGRGRAAIPWAILKGLEQTGVTLFKLDGGVDTGPIVAQQVVPIGVRETSSTLYQKVNEAHQTLMLDVWPFVCRGEVPLVPQDEALATEWPGRRPEDGRILPGMSLLEVDRLVRATTRPYPGAYVDVSEETRMRVWSGSLIEPPRGESRPISMSDGNYFATDFEYEPAS